VERGREVEGRSKEGVGQGFERAKETAKSTWSDLGSALDETLTAGLHRLGVPTRDEIRNLTQRVEELSAKIEQLRARPAGGTGATETAPSGHTVVDSAGNPVSGPGNEPKTAKPHKPTA
jgi:hypothetical protein